MVKIKVDTKITLDFGGISHELTKEEAREIVRLLRKAIGGDDGKGLGPVGLKKIFEEEREEQKRKKVLPPTPYVPYRQPAEYPRWPFDEIPKITFGGLQ